MTSGDHEPVPTEIQLHQKSRVLEIGFDDGTRFCLPGRRDADGTPAR